MQAGPVLPRPASWRRARQTRPPGGWELLLYQADHPIVVATAAVDDAEAVTIAVVEQVKVVTDELHLEQGLVDRHRAGRVHLLAQDQRAVALHLDGDQATLGFGLIRVGAVAGVAGPGPRDPMAVHRRGRRGRRRAGTRRGLRHRVGQHARRPDRDGVLELAPVRGPAQAGLELGEGEVERDVPVVRGRLGPDRGTTGSDGQLDPLTAVRLPWVTFFGDLHVDPHRLGVKLLELG